MLPRLTKNLGEDYNLGSDIPFILSAVCRYDDWRNMQFAPVPDRPEWIQGLAPAQVYKKDSVLFFDGKWIDKRGNPIKAKSSRGFVWADSDPLQILLNKFGAISSCHTLDSSNNTRAGNITHLYNPYLFCVFAGGKDPRQSNVETHVSALDKPEKEKAKLVQLGLREATSAKTGRPLILNRKSMYMRDYQAVCNCAFVRDAGNNPYILIGRLYDSCKSEMPWGATIVRYIMTRAKRLGLGVILSALTDYGDDLIILRKAPEVRTPCFKFGTGRPEMTVGYPDHSMQYHGFLEREELTFDCPATNSSSVLLEPNISLEDSLQYGGLYPTGTLRSLVDTPSYGDMITGESYNKSELTEWGPYYVQNEFYGYMKEAIRQSTGNSLKESLDAIKIRLKTYSNRFDTPRLDILLSEDFAENLWSQFHKNTKKVVASL